MNNFSKRFDGLGQIRIENNEGKIWMVQEAVRQALVRNVKFLIMACLNYKDIVWEILDSHRGRELWRYCIDS